MKDLLQWTGVGHCVCFSPTVLGIVTHFPTFEAPPFPHAFRTLLGGELLESDCINFHGVGVMRGLRGLGALDPEAWVARVSPEFIYT